MEGTFLSRMCSRQLVLALGRVAINGGDLSGVRLRLVRKRREQRLGPDVSHLVCTWQGADGVRASARQCMCGEVAESDYDEG